MESNWARFGDPQRLINIKASSVRGGAATMALQGVNFILQTGAMIIIARLLSPADFGLVAIVTAITGFVAMFKDAGLSLATIQRKHITHEQVSTLFWVNVVIGAGLTSVVSGLAPIIARFYHDPRLLPVMLVLAGNFLVMGCGVQHRALLRRQMRFTFIALNNTCSLGIGLISAILAAMAGLGYWALVVQIVVMNTFGVAVDWIGCTWRPGAPQRNTGIRPMLAFGGNFAGFSCINYFARNADNILVGWRWGEGALGIYSRAYQLLILPLTQIKVPIESVAVPALSRLSNDPAHYRNFYYREMSLLMWCAGPLVAILAGCASEVVALVLGDQWLETTKVFKILAATALFQPLYSATAQIFISMGRADRQLKGGIAVSLILILSFAIGLPFGPIGVATAYTLAFNLLILPWYFFYAFSGTPLTIAGLWQAVRHPMFVSVGIYLITELLCRKLHAEPAIVRLLCAAAASFLFLGSLAIIVTPIRAEVRSIFSVLRDALNMRRKYAAH